MYAYAFVGYFDYETEAHFREIWKGLSDSNITQYGVETKGKRPHITIADYDNLDINRFVELLDDFYDNKPKIDVSLNILGTFITTGTLFIAPAMSTELYDFHKNHHSYFKAFDKNKNSFYLTGMWSPHCTVASRLSEGNMIQAFGYCKRNISKINGKINEVALIEIELDDYGAAIEDKIVFSAELK